jgi:NAD(P)-dependent dehydrogenase (short-subunit alcohol dehydrogenase family)
MLLENKNAIVYGAGGEIGGGVARTFAREGASAPHGVLPPNNLAEQAAHYGGQAREHQPGVPYPGIFVLEERGGLDVTNGRRQASGASDEELTATVNASSGYLNGAPTPVRRPWPA